MQAENKILHIARSKDYDLQQFCKDHHGDGEKDNCLICKKDKADLEEREAISRIDAARGMLIQDKYQKLIDKSLYSPAIIKAAEAYFLELVEGSSKDCLLRGNVGTGKTHLGCYIMINYQRKTGKKCRFITASSVAKDLKASFGDHQSDLAYVDLLMIDDVGIGFGNDFEKNAFYLLVNERTAMGRPTIYTTNLNKSLLDDAVGEQTADRMIDGSLILSFKGESLREKSQEVSDG